MIKSSEAYKAAITADARRTLLRAVVEIIDPDMVITASTSSGKSKYSKIEQIHDKEKSLRKYATLERNRWILDGTFDVLPDNPSDLDGEVAMVGDTLSDADGVFSTPQWVQLNFENVGILQAFSVFFSDQATDGVPADFTVEVKQGGTTYFSKEYTANTEKVVNVTGFTVNNPDAIRLTVTKWSMPYRRFRVAEIIPGIYEEWNSDILASFHVKQQGDVSARTVPYGTCTLTMDNVDRRFEPRTKDGLFQSIEERQGIDVAIGVQLEGSGAEYKQVGTFYQSSGGWKTGDNGLTMTWELVDIIGLLSDREYIVPSEIPTTLDGWVASVVAQLGTNFAGRYIVDENYKTAPVTAFSKAQIEGRSCGEVLKYACLASGTWARADSSTGFLAVEPVWNEGDKVTLDDIEAYPIISANEDIGVVSFTIYKSATSTSKYYVSGNSEAAASSLSIDSPFIHTEEQARDVAKRIMESVGGNVYSIISRGNPASEIGDVDTLWLNESTATTARRTKQDFSISNGVLTGCSVSLVQPNGSFTFRNREKITTSGTWKAPAGVSEIRVILVGKGQDGQHGTAGTWKEDGKPGDDGLGGLVWSDTIQINEEQEFDIRLGENTFFGQYSSANGERYANGYTDVASGDSFARAAVQRPIQGTGDGGKGGRAGRKGERHEDSYTGSVVIDSRPTNGGFGSIGALGCVVIYYNKPGV